MARFDNLVGQVFTHLTVVSQAHKDSSRVTHWHCRCSCGEEVTVAGNNLKSGNSKSCGCSHGVPISNPITLEQLRSLVYYDPVAGVFTWLVDGRAYKYGDVAGYYNEANGYVRLTFKKVQYYAHVLAWFYMTGAWPEKEIDHEDTDGSNNKWKNLRLATPAQNGANKKIAKRNKTGYKGVTPYGKSKFLAQLTRGGKLLKIGVFGSAAAAARADDSKAREIHKEFARTNF